ncbi:hypothetical protein D3C75_875030 [compost metagenome]
MALGISSVIEDSDRKRDMIPTEFASSNLVAIGIMLRMTPPDKKLAKPNSRPLKSYFDMMNLARYLIWFSNIIRMPVNSIVAEIMMAIFSVLLTRCRLTVVPINKSVSKSIVFL